jgi:outer membrane protein assembly factor BamB
VLEECWNMLSTNSTIALLALICSLAGVTFLAIAPPGFAITSKAHNNMTVNPSLALLPNSYSSSARNNTYATLSLTPNMIAAGGPIPPNSTIAQQEAQCAAATANPGWYPTLSPAEHHDSARAELYPCAQFPGSYTGPNTVYAYPSTLNTYITPFNMATRGINEMFVYGGAAADALPPTSQTYVASVEPGTLNEHWRTYLNNGNITKQFYLQGAVYTLPDGTLAATAGHQLFKLNATTGAIIAKVTLPTGNNPQAIVDSTAYLYSQAMVTLSSSHLIGRLDAL